MNHLILVPHQDDELIGCYSIMKLHGCYSRVATVFMGGGEPKPNPYTPAELHAQRCNETVTVCRRFGVKDFDFLRIRRGTDFDVVKKNIASYLEYRSPTGMIFTTFPFDKHPEHEMLGSVIKELKVPAYGFIVQTTKLELMRETRVPDITYNLSTEEYEEKIALVDLYQTQRHFLPNIIRRPAYKQETFWKI